MMTMHPYACCRVVDTQLFASRVNPMPTLADIRRIADQRLHLVNRISPVVLAEVARLHQNGQLTPILIHMSARAKFKRLASKSIALALRKNIHSLAVEMSRSTKPKTFSAEASKYARSVTGSASAAKSA